MKQIRIEREERETRGEYERRERETEQDGEGVKEGGRKARKQSKKVEGRREEGRVRRHKGTGFDAWGRVGDRRSSR